MDVGDLAGQPDPPQGPGRIGPVFPGVVTRVRDPERKAGVANVDALPGQSGDHRVELWVHALTEEHLVDLARDRQLGLQLPDPPLRHSKLELLIGAQARDLATIDPVLLEPVTDRRVTELKRRRQLRHARPSPRQLDHLATDLGGTSGAFESSFTAEDSSMPTPPTPGQINVSPNRVNFHSSWPHARTGVANSTQIRAVPKARLASERPA